MKMRVMEGPDSLRRGIFGAGVVMAIVLMTAFGVLLMLSSSMRRELDTAADAFIKEQDVADELLRAVSRQLVAASFFARYQSPQLMTDFRAAGEDAYDAIRRYLGHPLTTAQRLQLEAVKEQHGRMEVAAAEAFRLFQYDHDVEAARSAEMMVARSQLLQQELDRFLAMREQDLVALRERQEMTFRYLYLTAVALAVLLIIGFLLMASFLNRRITSPLRALMNATTRIAAGDLGSRVSSKYNDEFAAVSESFNRMTERLAGSHLELEERNAQLQTAVDTLQTMQKELVQTEKLSAMGRMMAGLAHELNNPLASVLGYAELLNRHFDESDSAADAAEDPRRELVEPLLEQAIRARALVRDFLQYARQDEAGVTGVRLHDALDVVVRLRAYAFKQAGLEISLDADPEVYVLAKPQRLEQIFLNLANNAFDAMAPQGYGTLRVRTERHGDVATVRFEDDGPGFEFPDRVFDPFFTTKPVGSGTGLGLTMVHQFMDEFGGSVRAENRREGGAGIVLRFRVGKPDAMAPPQDVTPAAAADAIRNAAILVVEDEAPLRLLQKRLLERHGAEVFIAADVEEAQRFVEENVLDLIVSDLRMPGVLNGMDLFRWIEEEHPYLADRFLLVTGDVTGVDMVELAQYPGDRVLHKPFMVDEYVERVSRMLDQPTPEYASGRPPKRNDRPTDNSA